MRLDGQRAIVTGAGSGIGEAIAALLAQHGARVVAADVDETSAARVAEAIAREGGTALPLKADVSQEKDVQALVDRTVTAWGGVDILVCNAGIGVAAALGDTTTEDWNRVLAVNLTGTFFCCRAVLPVMLAQGAGNIVAISSVAGQVGVRERAAYCASKAGIVGLIRSIVADYAPRGIRANCVLPGTVDSPWIGKILQNHPDPVQARRLMESRQLIGRMGTPREIAEAVLWLVSPASSFAYGTCLVVDGGMTAV